MTYQSNKDFWLLGLVWGITLLVLCGGGLVYFASDAAVGRELIFSAAATAAIVLVLTYPLNYELTEADLVARCGVMRWRVALDSIEEARPCRSYLSAPAWSADRLRVSYRKGPDLRTLEIAPADKPRFLADLADAAPGLELRGSRVVRVP